MWFHELDPYRCAVLRKNFPTATVVEGDIRALSPDDVPGEQAHFFAGIGGFGLACRWANWTGELWTGGFPCQDISCAGKGIGLDGERSNLWFEWLRIIRARRPLRLLIENVPALRTRGYDRIHDALETLGYAVRPIVVGAWACGLHHRRNRLWIVANFDETRRSNGCGLQTKAASQRRETAFGSFPVCEIGDRRSVESSLVRTIHGIPARLARKAVEALGDSIVPQVAAAILRAWQRAELERIA